MTLHCSKSVNAFEFDEPYVGSLLTASSLSQRFHLGRQGQELHETCLQEGRHIRRKDSHRALDLLIDKVAEHI